MSGIGADLPPRLLAKRKRKQEEEAANQSTISSGANTKDGSPTPEKRRRVVGPALPPAPLDERPSVPVSDKDDDSDDDDDDGFGPALPSTAASNHGNDYEDSSTSAKALEKDTSAAKPKRDDWMTMAPEADGLAQRMDPSRQRAKGFNTSKGAKAPPEKGGDGSIWHETPEQKRKRLENEMLRIAGPTLGSVAPTGPREMDHDEEAARKIREHNEKTRGPSLMEQHKVRQPDKADDDPSKRKFDREKDIGSGLLGRAERKDFLNKASGFSSKFSGGSYL
ncbi:hypothetical protein B0A48_14449 [Cryoendolithus antarcticus]|uniref:DUF3752 domain-containing protein n=1 Tax=Cryoendolithus antarcticus TaxID=1507870 RepID=A0A1V8SKR9_9PEZI|nr:hypothetical protein B0A48_14449 [Cryoendolithus antarcticus]